MLLLIALANVHVYVYARPIGVRGYPQDLSPAERVVAVVQLTLVDGRAYPLFALLFGYGIWQLSARRAAVGLSPEAVLRLVRRRGWWMVAIGLADALLWWSGDVVAIYGIIGIVLAGMFVRGTDRALLGTAWLSVALGTLIGLAYGLDPPDAQAMLPSVALADPVDAALVRIVEWLLLGVVFGLGVFGMVAFGVWAARRAYLDDPARFRPLLRRVAVCGIAVAAVGGLPLALVAAEVLPSTPGLALPAAALHTLSGYAGGVGYAPLFGLLAVRVARTGTGPVTGALLACGQRSLSCYLAQSVAIRRAAAGVDARARGGAVAVAGRARRVRGVGRHPGGRRRLGARRLPRARRGAAAAVDVRPYRARLRALRTPVLKPARCSPPWKRACSTFRHRSMTTSRPAASARRATSSS
jgi:uncharacterized membrane protein YeiB